MTARAHVKIRLVSALQRAEAVTFAYPTATDASTWVGGTHTALVAQTPRDHGTDFLLTFTATDITFSWLHATTLPAGTEITVVLVAPVASIVAESSFIAPRPGLIRSQAWCLRDTAATVAGATYSMMCALESDFDCVRFVLRNDQLATYTIDAMSVAPSAQINNGYDAVDSAGSAVTPTTVTFNNAGADGLSPSPAGATATITVPAATDVDNPVYAYSDWIPLLPLARVDAGNDGRPLIVVRTFSSTVMRASAMTGTFSGTPTWLTEGEGRVMRTRHRTGGNYTTGALGAAGTTGGSQIPAGVQYYARRRGATVLTCGDSLTQGMLTGNGDSYAWGHYATVGLSTRDRPIAFVNGGWAGQAMADYTVNGRASVDAFRPDIVTVCVWSPNDGSTQAVCDSNWRQAIELLNYAVSRGAVPVLVTAVPFGQVEATDALRRQMNDRARAYAATNGMLLIDADAAVTDGATPGASLIGFRASSGNHLSVAGYRAIGAAAAPVLSRALNILGFPR